jgi:hypothetical protein
MPDRRAEVDDAPNVGPADRLRLVPCATRRLGDDLLVNVGGATRPVERLTGIGPELWACLGAGLTIAEATARVAARTGATAGTIERQVVDYAEALVRAGLAELEP